MKRFVLTNIEELKEFLSDFKTSAAFDTETTSLKYIDLEVEGISLCDGNKACYMDLTTYPSKTITKIFSLIFGHLNTIVAHNIVYDMKVIHKYGISLKDKKIYDTMVADHLINENREHGLKFLAKHILGYEEVMSYEEARKKGGDTFIEYATNDAMDMGTMYVSTTNNEGTRVSTFV